MQTTTKLLKGFVAMILTNHEAGDAHGMDQDAVCNKDIVHAALPGHSVPARRAYRP